MVDPQERGSSVGGGQATHVQTRKSGSGPAQRPRRRARQQRSQQVRTTNAKTSKNRTWPSQRTRRRATRSPTTAVRSLQRGSVLLQRCGTKRAAVANRSVEHEDSLWEWLTTSTTTTAATQTSAPEALQQWCSIQQKYWMELQRLQRRIQRTLDQIRGPSRQLPSGTPTGILEELRDRIQAIALDMSALNQSCNVESNTPRAPKVLSDLPSRKRRHSARFLMKDKDPTTKQFDDDEWIRSLTEAQDVEIMSRGDFWPSVRGNCCLDDFDAADRSGYSRWR